MTPFEALYGYPPPSIKEYVVSNFKAPIVKNYLATSDEILHILKNHLEQSRNQIKKQVDLKRTDHEFEVGDWVFVQLQPYK
jgi:predicted AlkP superfamily phosphohydrolase/phosphomutase